MGLHEHFSTKWACEVVSKRSYKCACLGLKYDPWFQKLSIQFECSKLCYLRCVRPVWRIWSIWWVRRFKGFTGFSEFDEFNGYYKPNGFEEFDGFDSFEEI